MISSLAARGLTALGGAAIAVPLGSARSQGVAQGLAAALMRRMRSTIATSSMPPLFKVPAELPAIADIKLEERKMSPWSRRTGLIAIKAGMTQEWDDNGVRVPLTVLWVDDCQVVQVKHAARDNVTSMQLGAGSKRAKQLGSGLQGHFLKAEVPFKRKLEEFKVTDDALLPVGTEIGAAHFMAGQYVDVTGTTIGKGFQGVMKLHNFSGQPASHGNSLSHRKPGAIGGCQDPGRVFKGKRMPGRMGNKRRTVHNVYVYRVDPERNLLYVRGQVPGHTGNFLRVRDAVRKPFAFRSELPFPTYVSDTLAPATTAQAQVNPYKTHF